MLLFQELYTAIETGNVEEVELILQKSKMEDPDAFNLNQRLRPMYDMTPLHLAVGLNSDSIVKLLLKFGSDPNCLACSESVSPLHLSVLYDLENMVTILIKNGGDPTLLDGEKKSCFDLATENDVAHLIDRFITDADKSSVAVIEEHDDKETLRKATSCLKDDRLSTESTPAPEDNPKFPSDIESFQSCRTSRSVRPVLTDIPPPKRESDNDSLSSSVPSSHEVWSPTYSYEMTEDETELSGGSDADKSSDTMIEDTSQVASVSSVLSLSCSITTPFAPPPVKVPTPEELKNLTDAVKNLGIRVPVTQSTYPILNQRIGKEAKELQTPSTPAENNGNRPESPMFSSELQASLLNLELVNTWRNLKVDLLQSLTPTKRTSKSFYNYVLLDPKVIKRANFSGNHLKSDIIWNPEKFERFLTAIFYVGKGCGNRPISHLVDAKAQLLQMKRTFPTRSANAQNSEKLSKILQIWKSGQGVILHSVFHHSAERESNINEAAMIDALGIDCNLELTNLKKGSYLGTGASQWSQKAKNQFGAFLLHKCFSSFVVSDARVFFPQDV